MLINEVITDKNDRLRDEILTDVERHGGSLDDYFVRFTDKDKIGYSLKQKFGTHLDVDHPEFNIDWIGPKPGGKRALWFYPLRTFLDEFKKNIYGAEYPYLWIVKIKPNAWLQPVTAKTKGIENPPDGKERVGILKKTGRPQAVFFKPAFDVVNKHYNYGMVHKRHGNVKGPLVPVKHPLFQKILPNY